MIYYVMSTLELREELFREMNPLLDTPSALEKVLAFVKGLVIAQQAAAPRAGWAAAAKQAHDNGEDKLMVADVFSDDAVEDWQW
jgi:antitoxin MazE